MIRPLLALVLSALVAAACAMPDDADLVRAGSTGPTSTAATVPTGPAAPPAPTQPEATSTTAPPVVPAATEPRFVEQPWVPFGVVGDLVLHHPSDRVETIGFHQSNHEGARRIEVLETAVRPIALPDRERLSDQQSAADIAVAPDHPIRAPVTGTVLRAGGYTLYCDKTDNFVVIEPDGMPGLEVKILHMVDNLVSRGDRVVAGGTPIGSASRILPFVSDVDEFTGEPSSPHVHVEVVDTSIPNVAGPNSGSEDC